ncbi:hypothetical protein ACSQ67_024014 [Phaseolus vulgaris]
MRKPHLSHSLASLSKRPIKGALSRALEWDPRSSCGSPCTSSTCGGAPNHSGSHPIKWLLLHLSSPFPTTLLAFSSSALVSMEQREPCAINASLKRARATAPCSSRSLPRKSESNLPYTVSSCPNLPPADDAPSPPPSSPKSDPTESHKLAPRLPSSELASVSTSEPPPFHLPIHISGSSPLPRREPDKESFRQKRPCRRRVAHPERRHLLIRRCPVRVSERRRRTPSVPQRPLSPTHKIRTRSQNNCVAP